MRIGIFGGGAAGLATAWLLEQTHEVTLFEKQARLGGHAHTLELSAGGERVTVEAGFEFFSARMFPCLQRLLRALGVETHRYPMTTTFYTADHRYVTLLPPTRNGRLAWRALGPRQIGELLQFQLVLSRAARLMAARDTSITIDAFLRSLPITRAFREGFMLPYLLASWCLAPGEFRDFAAYNVLRYIYLHRPTGLEPVYWIEVAGGMRTYVESLAGALSRATLRLSADVVGVTRTREGFSVEEGSGLRHEFDQLVVATNAAEARRLLASLEGADEACRALGSIDYFETKIAVHGDRRLMPRDPRDWSVVNFRYDGTHSQTTVWKHWKSRSPVFRSWITFEPELPEPLYSLAEYRHAKVTPRYFAAQKSLAARQGQNGLWMAGVYTVDVDCHESAILSATQVAQRLAPGSERLRQVLGT